MLRLGLVTKMTLALTAGWAVLTALITRRYRARVSREQELRGD